MLRVYRSESPLLDYINFQFYRTPGFSGIRTDDGQSVYNACMFLIGNLDLTTKENYLDWVQTWKDIVMMLSGYNHAFKRPKSYLPEYERTLRSTMRLVAKERYVDLTTVDETEVNKIRNVAKDRIENFSSFLSTALTQLYAARATGKLATSAIVMMTRDNVTSPRLLRSAA